MNCLYASENFTKRLETSCMCDPFVALYGVKSDEDKFLTQLYLQLKKNNNNNKKKQ